MTITVLGASAGVGLKAVKRALERNHTVVALSRSPVSIPDHPNLIKQIGSATDRDDLMRAISNADAVIVALGTGKSTKATTLYSDFAKLLVSVQSETRTSVPFILVTGFGAGASGAYNSFLMKLFFRLLLQDVYSDKTRMETIISKSAVRWILVRPGMLTNKPLTENYRVEKELYKGIRITTIGRSDVADYLVKQAENPTDLFQFSALSNN